MLRTPAVLPTGRNLHGFDPFRIPSAYAVKDGAKQAQRLLDCHLAEGNGLPESIAIVLWRTDIQQGVGGQISQALAQIGAEPRFDSYGRIGGAPLIDLEALACPRIDFVLTLSGIFRDFMLLLIKMLASAAYLAASADDASGCIESFPFGDAVPEFGDRGCGQTSRLSIALRAASPSFQQVKRGIGGFASRALDRLAYAAQDRFSSQKFHPDLALSELNHKSQLADSY